MMTRTVYTSGIVGLLLLLTSAAALGQTPLGGGFEITLPPGFTHKPLQGIDSTVGKVVSKDGMEIMYEIGLVLAKGGLAFGGSYSNRAAGMPEGQRAWLKEQTVGGLKFTVAYSKDQRLTVSAASTKQSINFSTLAKTPAEVADVLLTTLALVEQKPK